MVEQSGRRVLALILCRYEWILCSAKDESDPALETQRSASDPSLGTRRRRRRSLAVIEWVVTY
jgi:hypothetical protein